MHLTTPGSCFLGSFCISTKFSNLLLTHPLTPPHTPTCYLVLELMAVGRVVGRESWAMGPRSQ